MAFITEDFLLQSRAARHLYHTYARCEPILDYHCHLSAKDIAEDRRFRDLTEIWLEGDHYKWRAMRAHGVAERLCTGDSSPHDKFLAWARTLPSTLRNPLYQWTHLELNRYFGIGQLLDERTAPEIWEAANEQLGELTARAILEKFHIHTLCTTDDPTDSLEHHACLARSGFRTQVLPAFRPDRALHIESPQAYGQWLAKLEAAADLAVSRLPELLEALARRHSHFHAHGCRLSDHGLDWCYAEDCTVAEAEGIFARVRAGAEPSSGDCIKFASFLMRFFGQLDAQKGWTKQLHLGACRNTNTRMFRSLGLDTGFDCIGDRAQAGPLLRYLDGLDRDHTLPQVIVYNVNPADDYVFASTLGSFTAEGVRGKLQYGTAWWFLDQKEGIEWHLNALSNCGLLSNFIGMTTDSRSFMSFPRHEYFRRVLCNLLGAEMESGLLPNEPELIGRMVSNICFANAKAYLALPPGDAASPTQAAAKVSRNGMA